MLAYFKGSFLFTAVCLALAVWLGWAMTGSAGGTAGVLWIVVVLSVLEVSLSFDNAVVNAAVLRDMDAIWRRRFLTWGIAFAVFGMRIVFPLAIVAIAASLGPIEAVRLAAANPVEYERIITSAHVGIAGFGGAFLAMVGLKFFFDSEKEVHWIDVIEERLSRLSSVEAIEIAIVLLALYGISTMLPREEAFTYLVAGIFGILAYLAVEAVNALLKPDAAAAAGAVARSGLAGFLYLNLLDSAFSFDGVIGAFALSNNIFVIALGLGIGAMFVRSMTILLVDKGTLAEYRYLEHGAFWAILALAAIMLFSARFHIPEVVTGLIGALLIGFALYASVKHNRKQRAAEAGDRPVGPSGRRLDL
ncbi:MAG TPA: DUF475 domain-containing protein [Allosphingosinicella sp.]|nr:DUF475 domain-containing protein [Allosphingosinicella sp.]